MNEFEKMFYTAGELRDIEAGAAAYDRQCEAALRPETTPAHLDVYAETQQAIENDRLEHLTFLHEEIADMVRVREQFPGSNHNKQMTEHIIRVRQVEIENILEEIYEYRENAKT